jgi:hypothetical protein
MDKAPFLTVVIWACPPILYFIYRYQHTKKREQYECKFKEFLLKQEEELKEKLKENPDFHTFCFECHHFNESARMCTFHFNNQKIQLVVNAQTYCLLWNVFHYPVIGKS